MTDTPIEELYLHIFIGSMVLIRDFYDRFGHVYAEPAQPETELSVHFMGFFMYVADHLGPNKQLIDITAPLLATKITSELGGYGQEDIVAVKQQLLETAHSYSSQPTQTTALGDLAVDSLLDHVCSVVHDSTPTYRAYATKRIRNILEEAVPFKELVGAVA